LFRGINQKAASAVNPTAYWWFVDMISCAAVRGSDVDEHGIDCDATQRDLMREKIKCVFRAAAAQGAGVSFSVRLGVERLEIHQQRSLNCFAVFCWGETGTEEENSWAASTR
jgi:hypothetical protein